MKNKLYMQTAGSFTLLLFAALAYILRFYPDTLAGFDRAVIETVHRLSPGMNSFFLWITKFANPLTIVILTVVFLTLFWLNRQKITALWFAISMAGISGAVNHLLKLFFHRARPTILPHMVTEHSFSFPSGHSTASMLIFGTLILVAELFVGNKTGRRILQVLLGLLILAIGVSRVYLGVHYPTDVLAGFLLGSSWLLLTYPYYRQYKLVYDMKQIQKKRS
ncbi:phosphatase PAP2 family protein [Enterococcus florum]|uniref:Phosphatase PAP2 family protein n=1 Tax=Enterococcus florum TaxID=2480627 RepID=A0A4P5PCI7_9ENTE|nr:phosphatase PAP2 family protein [Enterococcus florum]GCF93152.1 phosphatase PAP2 family protein [Enterococcus florum]